MDEAGRISLTYRDAGVDIDRGNRLVERIKAIAGATRREGVISGIGGFGALFELPVDRYRRPVLVSGADGVGTKIRIAIETDRHDTIGIDLVAMCANDILVLGAEPLYFLDYLATGRLDSAVAERVMAGIGRGCEQAGAALIGGETAEMPGMYADGDYDLAGFCVGVAERDRIIDAGAVRAGDALIGIASSGPHSNGYSLIRKIIEVSGTRLDATIGDRTLADWLAEPTRIYVRSVLPLLAAVEVHALAHITGGGLVENVPRVLPDDLRARIDPASWRQPAIFDWLESAGGIDAPEMRRTFNCGVGMVVCVSPDESRRAIELLAESGETAWEMGCVETRPEGGDTVAFS